MDFIYNDYIKFSFQLTTCIENDEEKKSLKLPKGWQKITKSILDFNHNGVGIITGKTNNLTVFDFDNLDEYNKFFEYFSHLNRDDYFTVKTRRGFHLYFQYDEDCITGSNVMDMFNDIDIRNDGGFITGPPTTYKLLDGTQYSYDYVDTTRKIHTVPKEFKQFLKTLNKKIEKEQKRIEKEQKRIEKEQKLTAKEQQKLEKEKAAQQRKYQNDIDILSELLSIIKKKI
jgi:hypothetical protein